MIKHFKVRRIFKIENENVLQESDQIDSNFSLESFLIEDCLFEVVNVGS